MSLSFKVLFHLSDFEDDEFLQDVYKLYNNVIVLEHKSNKEKIINNIQHLKQFIKISKIIIFNLVI